MGLTIFGIPQYHVFYKAKGRPKIITQIPIGYLPDFLVLALKYVEAKDINIIDRRVSAPDSFFADKKINITLRPFQRDLVDVFESKTIGVFQAKTGSGKTISFITGIVERGQRTLILAHTKELVDQTIKSIVGVTNISKKEIGIIGGGKYDVKPLSVGTIQTLASYNKNGDDRLDYISDYFGQVVVDETHIVPATTYFDAINSLKAKHKFGFSATPYREDGLTDLIKFGVGPIVHVVPDEAVSPYLIVPTYEQVETDFEFLYFEQSDYQPMISYLSEDYTRNQLILDTAAPELSLSSCFLCQRTSQVHYLASKIPKCAALTSELKKKEREAIMADIKSGKYLHVASTFGLFSTGIDVPGLERLYICAPIQSSIKLKQSAGRLMRQAEGKTSAKIIDFVDNNVGILAGQARKRKKILTNL